MIQVRAIGTGFVPSFLDKQVFRLDGHPGIQLSYYPTDVAVMGRILALGGLKLTLWNVKNNLLLQELPTKHPIWSLQAVPSLGAFIAGHSGGELLCSMTE